MAQRQGDTAGLRYCEEQHPVSMPDRPHLHYYSEQLRHKLDQIPRMPTAVLEAPPAYGKTTAVHDCLETSLPPEADVQWLTAVPEAPEALYQRFCRAIEKIDRKAGTHLLKNEFPNAFTVGEACDALRSIACDHEVWLVIDHFEHLSAMVPPVLLTALLEHSETALHTIIITEALGKELASTVASNGFLHITMSDLKLDADDILSYYLQEGLRITRSEAQQVLLQTDGWISAVYLQLCDHQETGAFSEHAVQQFAEHLIWDKLDEEQQRFLCVLALFKVLTVREICELLQVEALPDHVIACLSGALFSYDAQQQLYEIHEVLRELVARKRAAFGATFEQECLARAGDLCRSEGDIAEALCFYIQTKDYDRILSLDLSSVLYEAIGEQTFIDIALEITRDCPPKIRRAWPLSMLRVAWAVRSTDAEGSGLFEGLLDELDETLPQTGPLRAEWFLLSAWRHFPDTARMLPAVKKAEALFNGACSQVITREAPWAFGNFSQIAEFHQQVGQADAEYEALEAFLALYSPLTGGNGSGADALLRAEIAYNRGDLVQAEISAYKAAFLASSNQQGVVQLGVALLLADIALYKADLVSWQNTITLMENAASYASQNNFFFRSILDVSHAVLLVDLGSSESIASWLQDEGFPERRLIGSLSVSVLYVRLMLLRNRGDWAQLIGTLEALPPKDGRRSAYTKFIATILLATGYLALRDEEKGRAFLQQAAETMLPDGLITDFVSFTWSFREQARDLVAQSYPELLDAFDKLGQQRGVGWHMLRDATVAGRRSATLTEREREVAQLAAGGLHNREIALRLFVSESTVRTHLRVIFQKLGIDRRSKLAEALSF